MIALNTKQGLAPNAFWYVALRSLVVALLVALLGALMQLAAAAPGASCRGALCGKLSGGQVATIIYLFAAFLIVRAVVKFKWFSFVLTDRNITINSGLLFQNSCTIRFDRIQDVNAIRDPLHMLLGLKSVAIWTASADQRIGKSRRPDGLLVLEAEDADWLTQYLSEAPHAAGTAGAAPVSARRSGAGAVVAVVAVVALVALGLFALTRKASVPSAATAAAAPATAVTAVPANRREGRPASHPHVVRPVANVGVAPQTYGLACAIDPAAGAAGMHPCATLEQARRCTHESDFRSQPTQTAAVLSVVNRSDREVKFYWLNFSGGRTLYASLPPGGHVEQQSHLGAHWLIATPDERCVGIFDAATTTLGIF